MADENTPTPAQPDAPDKEKMDQIRRRRLEKLSGSGSGSGSSSTADPSSAAPIKKTETALSDIKSSPNATSTTNNPFTDLSQINTQKPINEPAKPSINIKPADSSTKRTRTDVTDAEGPIPRKVQETRLDTIEEFENKTISGIFRLSLDQGKVTDHLGHRLVYLPSLREELEESDDGIRFSVSTLDTALGEAISKYPHTQSPLEYLLPCWKRVLKAQKSLRGYTNAKDGILKEIRRLCLSYCIFAVTLPELFGREPKPAVDSLVPFLLNSSDADHGIDLEFLKDAVARFDEDDSVKTMFTKAMAGMSSQLAKLDMNDDYKPYVNAMKMFAGFPLLITAIAQDPLFQLAVSAPNIENMTLLGPYFRISPLQPSVAKTFFAGPKTMNPGQVASAGKALQMTLSAHQDDLKQIVQVFVRAGDISRNRILDWFAHIVNSNHKRRAYQVDERLVSSDGFMMNITVVLDHLCEPFMDSTFSKVDKIDIDYLRRQPRVDIKDETKINADQKTSDEFYKTQAEGKSNFISEVFFLTLAAHQYGSESVNAKQKTLEKHIKHFRSTIAQMETERPKFANNPVQLQQFENAVKKYNDVLEKSMSLHFAIEGVLFDRLMQTRSMAFMRYVIVWLLRIATSSTYLPGKTIALPLAGEQPPAFQNLPEYALEIAIDNFKFIYQVLPDIILSSQTDDLVTLCITFLRSSDWIKNPGIKAGFVTLLYHGTVGRYRGQKGVLTDVLFGSKFANDHLFHALMQLYIECEHTGASTQFYDKFQIRWEIFQIIKVIWPNTIYRQRLTQESKINTEFFIRFVNLLLNDCTYVLDEALDNLPKIHVLQQELQHSQLTEEEKKLKTEALEDAEKKATSHMQLTNETMEMMKLFTSALSDAFTMPEIVQRLADMLDYNLATLVGPKSSGLKVADPAKYSFYPRSLLAVFIDTYNNLGRHTRFIEAVARDGRSYKPQNFESATRILRNYSLKSPEELASWEALIRSFATQKELDDQAEDDLGEIPDEFLDPLMASLMEDPVILPKSRLTIDRSTIRSHLLSDPTDPFNRQPMTIDEVVVDTDMVERIRKWKEERRAAVAAEKANKMDTS